MASGVTSAEVLKSLKDQRRAQFKAQAERVQLKGAKLDAAVGGFDSGWAVLVSDLVGMGVIEVVDGE